MSWKRKGFIAGKYEIVLKEEKNEDLLIRETVIPKFIKGDWIKNEAVVIDAGYHPEKCGDIELESIINRCEAYTPVPGGVGPMTINTLILQTIESCEQSLN